MAALFAFEPLACARAFASARGESHIADVPALKGLAERWTAALGTLDAPGFAVAIVKDGAVLALDGFGVRDVAGNKASPDTCYYIASATKPFTAMLACQLAADGDVDLDAPVKDYLPQLELPDAELTQKLTLRDLLCHRPGIDSAPIVQRDAYTGQITDELYFELLKKAEIAHAVHYSNVHFTLAARALEAVSGMKWQDLLAERLFKPAGMTRTTAYASEMYGKGEHAEPMLLVEGLLAPRIDSHRGELPGPGHLNEAAYARRRVSRGREVAVESPMNQIRIGYAWRSRGVASLAGISARQIDSFDQRYSSPDGG